MRVPGLAIAGLLAVALVGCSAAPPGLSAQRPVVQLAFDIADDLRTVTGHERVEFTPDRPVCELVFRAWPNKPTAARTGTALAVTAATVDGAAVEPRVVSAGAPEDAPGTLIELPLQRCREPGETVTAELDFRLLLGEDAGERFGFSTSPEMAWFATGFPLLAWVRGTGWARDDAQPIPGETAVSEDFKLAALAVTAPSGLRVLGTGTAEGTGPGPRPGRTTHRFTAEAVRNVAVSVGRFAVLEREVDGVRVHLATPASGTRVPPREWADELDGALAGLTELLGPYPYPDLWVTVVPTLSDGIEFPTALYFGDVARDGLPGLIAHELAHQWFYALVGNNQARDPWIDESFATFAQAVVTGQEGNFRLSGVPDRVSGRLGEPMGYWADAGGFARYASGVYSQGAAVLLEARRRGGPERFDAALRSFVDENAHRVVAPADVTAAFGDLPEVGSLLDEYGALEGDG